MAASSGHPLGSSKHKTARSRSGLLYEALLLAAFAFFVGQVNLFGEHTLFQMHSQDLANAALGHMRWFHPLIDVQREPRVVVLLADEKSLAASGFSWPPTEGFHAALMRELHTFKPRAVFIDFLFSEQQEPEGARELHDSLQALADSGSRIYMPLVDETTLRGLAVPDRDPLSMTQVGVAAIDDHTGGVARQYPVFGGLAANPIPSAAISIYCDVHPDAVACRDLTHRRFQGHPRAFEIMWNMRPDGHNVSWHERDCLPEFAPRVADLLLGRWRFENACPSVTTIFASDLISGGAARFGADNEQLFELLDGAIVLYGSAFRSAADTIVSPVRGRMPGVFYHAAALENLFAFEGRPKVRKADANLPLVHDLCHYLLLVFFALLFVLRQRMLTRHSAPHARSGASLKTAVTRELSRIPVGMTVGILVLAILVAALWQPLWFSVVVLGSLAVAAAEILGDSGGMPRLVAKRAAIYFGSILASVLLLCAYGYFSYAWLDEPPMDWIAVIVFVTLGWFLAYAPVSGYVDSLSAKRSAWLARRTEVS